MELPEFYRMARKKTAFSGAAERGQAVMDAIEAVATSVEYASKAVAEYYPERQREAQAIADIADETRDRYWAVVKRCRALAGE
jgi:hypothetical protein